MKKLWALDKFLSNVTNVRLLVEFLFLYHAHNDKVALEETKYARDNAQNMNYVKNRYLMQLAL